MTSPPNSFFCGQEMSFGPKIIDDFHPYQSWRCHPVPSHQQSAKDFTKKLRTFTTHHLKPPNCFIQVAISFKTFKFQPNQITFKISATSHFLFLIKIILKCTICFANIIYPLTNTSMVWEKKICRLYNTIQIWISNYKT